MLRLCDAQVTRRDGNCQEFLLVLLLRIYHSYWYPPACPISRTFWRWFFFWPGGICDVCFLLFYINHGVSRIFLLPVFDKRVGEFGPALTAVTLNVWWPPVFSCRFEKLMFLDSSCSEGSKWGHLNRTSFRMLPSTNSSHLNFKTFGKGDILLETTIFTCCLSFREGRLLGWSYKFSNFSGKFFGFSARVTYVTNQFAHRTARTNISHSKPTDQAFFSDTIL